MILNTLLCVSPVNEPLYLTRLGVPEGQKLYLISLFFVVFPALSTLSTQLGSVFF